MVDHSTDPPARQAINLRLTADMRALIDRAAQALGKSRTEFMVDAARRAAEDTLVEQTALRIDAATLQQFLDVLDKPPAGAGYDRLMALKRPWD